jgi:hypothetical protein
MKEVLIILLPQALLSQVVRHVLVATIAGATGRILLRLFQ